MKRPYRNYTISDLTEAVKTSLNLAETLRKLKLKPTGGNYEHLKKLIAQNNLDISHFTGALWNKGKAIKSWANYKKSTGRKNFLIQKRGHKCESCQLELWKDKPINLELHHVNGNRTDNEEKNLQLLCCNCHSFTDTWRRRK